jgi:membrane protein implicated in regulation of membrane protease activity
MTVRYNEDLDPNEGPGFGCFIWQALLFGLILLLIPVGLFSFNWPVWLLATLLGIDLILLFFLSMTSVFLLRVFFADRRRGRGRTTGQARQPTRLVITKTDPEPEPGRETPDE